MSETEDDLRATSDALLTDLRRLTALEEEKRPIEPDDPRLEEISAKVADVARRVEREGELEHELSREVTGRDSSS